VTPRPLALLALALSLSACAGPYEREAAFTAGWRVAEVVEVARAADIARGLSHDCRTDPSAASPDTPYAVLRYEAGSRHHRTEATAAVPADADVHVGEQVYVNTADCGAALVPRRLIPQTLTSHDAAS
jgi:hypothetical protein